MFRYLPKSPICRAFLLSKILPMHKARLEKFISEKAIVDAAAQQMAEILVALIETKQGSPEASKEYYEENERRK